MKPVPMSRFAPRSLELRSGYGLKEFKADARAGVTVGLFALPLALALGAVSMPLGARTPFPAPAIGLFTAVIAGFIVSALGGSRVQISGPTAVFLPIIPLVMERYGFDGLALATIMAGCILFALGVARLGAVIKLIPFPVTSGLTTGIAVSVIVSQTPDILGIASSEPAPRDVLERLSWIWAHIPEINPQVAATGLASILLIVAWPRLGIRRVPAAIVALVFASVLLAVLGRHHADGVATIGTRFGSNAIPLGFPPFTVPLVSLARIRGLAAPAIAIALLGSTESLLSAVVADGLTNDRHNSNTELIAQGAANILGPLFCALPSTGSVSRTSANIRSGGSSPVAGMVHAATLLAVILALSRLARFVPIAALAAVLVMAAVRLGEWNEFGRLRRMPRSDAVVLATTLLTTVFFDLVIAVEVGMVLAAFLLALRMTGSGEASRLVSADGPRLGSPPEHRGDVPDGVLVYEISSPQFFGAAEKMEDAIAGTESFPRALVLRMQHVATMDATALNTLGSIVERIQAADGVLILCSAGRQLIQVLVRAGLVEKIGRENIHSDYPGALARARMVAGRKARK